MRVLQALVLMALGSLFVLAALGRLPLGDLLETRRWLVFLLGLGGAFLAVSGVSALIGALGTEEQSAKATKRVQDAAVGATVIVSLLFGLFLFNYVPNMIAEQLRFAGVRSGTVINFATETVKLVFFFGYIALIGQMKEIKEVFKYHGAEHKAINTLEADEELNLDNCRQQTRLHPRCGTSFAIIVILVSFVVSTLTPRYLVTGGQGNWLIDVSARFLLEIFILLPIISGISYELIRFAGKFRNQGFVNVLFKPGLMSQYLTTKEPRDDQIEVALQALQACVDAEARHDAPPPEANALESSVP